MSDEGISYSKTCGEETFHVEEPASASPKVGSKLALLEVQQMTAWTECSEPGNEVAEGGRCQVMQGHDKELCVLGHEKRWLEGFT